MNCKICKNLVVEKRETRNLPAYRETVILTKEFYCGVNFKKCAKVNGTRLCRDHYGVHCYRWDTDQIKNQTEYYQAFIENKKIWLEKQEI